MAIKERPAGGIIERQVRQQPQYYPTFAGQVPLNESAMAPYQEQAEIGGNMLKGFGKSIGNTPYEIANIFRKQPLQKPFDISGTGQEIGSYIGDFATFGVPGKAIENILKYGSKLPKMGKEIKSGISVITRNPFLKNIVSAGRTGLNSLVYGLRKEPDQDVEQGAFNFGTGAGTQTLANLIAAKNPLVNLAARLGLGGVIGSQVGHPYYGAAMASAIPSLATMVGLRGSKNALASDMLSGLSEKDARKAVMANQRLGTRGTPAQMTGNYPASAREGALKRSPEAAQIAYRFENLQKSEQQRAIGKTLKSIYNPTPESEKAINDAYNIANKVSLDPKVIDQMKKNPNIESAFRTVKSDSSFENIPENNYRFLAEVERQLYRDQQGAYKTSPSSAHILGKNKKAFSEFLENTNPDYKKAKAIAQPRIIRDQIEEKFNLENEDWTAKNFYKRFLTKKSDYQEVLRNTKNFPQAQQALKDMRTGWKHLSNIKTVSQSEAQAKTAIDHARNLAEGIIQAINKMAQGKGDVQRIKYIYGKEWHKDFDRLMKIQDAAERNRKILSFFGRIATMYELQTHILEE